MDDDLTVQFAAALFLESVRMFYFDLSVEEFVDFGLMYCARGV